MIDGEVQGDNGVAAVIQRKNLSIVVTTGVELVIPYIAVASGFGKLTIDGGAVQHRHAVEIRLVTTQIHRIALDTCHSVKVKAVGHCRIITPVDTNRTILQVPVHIGGGVIRAGNKRRIDKEGTINVV